MQNDVDDHREDQVSFIRTVNAFRSYSRHALHVLSVRRAQIRNLSAEHLELLGGIDALEGSFLRQEAAIAANQKFLDAIVAASSELFASYWPSGMSGAPPSPTEIEPTTLDMDKVYSTLRQFVRDWSAEGAVERRSVYAPIVSTLAEIFPDSQQRGMKQVAMLGAGLSRLSVEVATQGFCVQGNEFSYHMLIAGHFAMNHCTEREAHTIQPFCDGTINVFSRNDQFRHIKIPDLTCYDHMDFAEDEGRDFGQLAMAAGDFVEVFSKEEQRAQWDVVVSCFFIDTAHNIVEYLQIIHGMLKPGGVWVNAGPLLYHFSDSLNEISIDLTYEEVKAVAARIGFQLQSESTISTTYTNNTQSMKQLVYHCPFFWCRK